jgi:hypothetical protein
MIALTAKFKRNSLSALTVLLLACATPAHAKRIALLIGINDYPSKPLQGAVNDVQALQSRLPRLGYTAENTVTLLDAQASKTNILREIAALETRSAAGDDVLIYFSGHGTSAKDAGLSNQLANLGLPLLHDAGAWLPHGFSDKPGPIPVAQRIIIGRTDLQPLLKRLDSGGRNVLVLSDSCFSGNLARSASLQKPTDVLTRHYVIAEPVVRRSAGSDDELLSATNVNLGTRPPRAAWPFSNLVQISAASDDQPANDMARPEDRALTIDGKAHGAFTDGLLRVLDGKIALGVNGKVPSFADLHKAMVDHMAGLPVALQSNPTLLPAPSDANPQAVTRAINGMAVSTRLATAAATRLKIELRNMPASEAASWKNALLVNADVVDRGADFVLEKVGGSVSLFSRKNDFVIDDKGCAALGCKGAMLGRINAEAWLRDILPKAANPVGLRADTIPAGLGNVFQFGDNIRLNLILEKPAEIIAIAIDAQGSLVMLHPVSRSEITAIPAAKSIAIPSFDSDCIAVGKPAGMDRVAVIALPAGTIPKDWQPPATAAFNERSTHALALKGWLQNAAGEVTWLDLNTQPPKAGAGARANYACEKK